MQVAPTTLCPICKGNSRLHDVLDFNKVCGETNAHLGGLSGIPIYYSLCDNCGFYYSPAIGNWRHEEFERNIYNDDYVKVDPDCTDIRPRQFAESLLQLFDATSHTFTHLDYGGGNGLLSQIVSNHGWDSTTYDPFTNKDVKLDQLGKFDLITAFEVFEHVPDVHMLMENLRTLLAPGGVIYFSTQLSDGHIHPGKKLDWWYVAPRNGHISLFSKSSLQLIGNQYSFNLASNWVCFHALFTTKPAWAARLIP